VDVTEKPFPLMLKSLAGKMARFDKDREEILGISYVKGKDVEPS